MDDALQKAADHATLVRFSAAVDFPHSVVDLSDVYAGQDPDASLRWPFRRLVCSYPLIKIQDE